MTGLPLDRRHLFNQTEITTEAPTGPLPGSITNA